MATKTTFHLSISRPALAIAYVRNWLAQRDPLVLIASLIAAPLIGMLLGTALYRSLPPAPLTAIAPTSAPIIIVQTAPAVVVPTPAAAVAAQLPRMIVAFDAPDGTALGAILAPDVSSIVARYGTAWAMVPWDAGHVWVRASDVGMPDVADLAPPPAPRIVYVAAQPPAEAVPTPESSYAVTSAPPAEQLSERQANIQGRMVDPNVAQAWAQQQWRDEHCIGETCIP